MTALTNCANSAVFNSRTGVPFNDPPTGGTGSILAFTGTPPGPAYELTARYAISSVTLLTGWQLQLYLFAGPAPYVRQQTLLTLQAPLVLDQDHVVTFPLNVTMVPDGRPFTLGRDQVGLNWNNLYDTHGVDGAQAISIRLCSGEFAVDCCAATLEKLDQILSFVSRTWPVVPSV